MADLLRRFIFFLVPICGVFAAEPGYEQAPIFYSKSEADTPITRIAEEVIRGNVRFHGESGRDVLVQLLGLLDVPVESQVLVFSKTSAQNSRISPRTPRAIYFSDNAYVGWVQGGDIEVTTFDPNLGMVFHLVDVDNLLKAKAPLLNRDRSCLNCHGGSATGNLPGVTVRSVYAGRNGQPIFHAGTFRTDYTSPLEERWGGWYVTGSSGDRKHMGNHFAVESEDQRSVMLEAATPASLTNLDSLIETDPYPAGGTSDIVALMVMEHQVTVHNALVAGLINTRKTLYRHRKMKEAFGESPDSPLSDTNRRILDNLADKIVRAIFFHDEHVVADGVEGAAPFQEAFSAGARKNREGRALRDLRLYERLFKYRCSHLIYSDAFAFLPEPLLERVIGRMKNVLAGNDESGEFIYLTDSERVRIDEILKDTLPVWSVY